MILSGQGQGQGGWQLRKDSWISTARSTKAARQMVEPRGIMLESGKTAVEAVEVSSVDVILSR